ncbi:glutathione S-transferase family protein [Pseudomonas paeninsulae]|uniref:glutathione S-transferase family protein n=1 Tax=Pseudomonas paeninsulae TaxID=3110772 RepID=UPI002D7A32D7|nr:glutathione S-transferase family protein [Pseudomonas sp. IT1137]
MSKTVASYTLYGAEMSYYSGKTRSHLLHKRIPFSEQEASAWDYLVKFPREVGCSVVPVVRSPEGAWLQDSSLIIDLLEQRFPAQPAVPASPVLRFAAYLFELWGDEFWLPVAMSTRWSRPEHRPLFVQEIGAGMLPGWPRFLQELAGNRIANMMSGFTEKAGFGADMTEVLCRFAHVQLDGLEAHFAQHKFLFGTRPSLGDYGLIGPLYAHIGRDPLSKRDFIDSRPHVAAWIARMFDPATSTDGEFFADDRLPETLQTALGSIVDEMIHFIAACADAVRKTPVLDLDAKNPPRFLEKVSYPMAGATHCRPAPAYAVWQAQRMLKVFNRMAEADQDTVRDWLHGLGASDLLTLDLPPMRRVGVAAAQVTATDAD